MRRDLADLSAFVAVARLGSFRRAAAELGVTASALSHALRALEERLGVRLLNRTTRSVSLTEAGEQLYARLLPAFEDVATAVDGVNSFRDRPAGSVRINVPRLAAATVIAPMLARFTAEFPEVRLEVTVDDGVVNIVDGRYDAGIRFGEAVERDMIAVRVSPDQRFAVVGSPAYFEDRPKPISPQDLRHHPCIGFRLPTSGVLYRWELEKDGIAIEVAPAGAPILNDPELSIQAALDGVGLAFTGAGILAPYIEDGRLVQVLKDWCPPFPGFFLYYPSRRHTPAALRALITVLQGA
ncbi:MAG: LysR family transcriptional regulator [Allosphingosinicella sp.]|uniref:LysR family transcriptional regulator n=1 Tax=Allosphingosinicella sp. TaxID=2823234 RepID=UPI0039299CAD